ncbi:hypothetical protein I601_2291 [Nocardioides dokdonensis FR1436]|uniref:Uncharacterized protein n=1 Tax=Nocardioides dokdonensis FR1436 TaxID=1300347 RepID=A0A1A9GMN1_9ACTN|nr:hypothetical protein [Nocardioides dokdonensis]ANH38715.1 hypothetical protein I601_2291 [Nocardioides dokdonensis FR1436]
MTRTTHRHRGETLRRVIAAADQRRDGHLPLHVEGVDEAFADELDLLGALQLRWHTRLGGHIERALVNDPLDLEQAVVTAWRATAEGLPGVRAVVDHHREHPLDDRMRAAMDKAVLKERAFLAVMAGQASATDAGAASVGARLEAKARAGWQPTAVRGQVGRPTLLHRLRAALAA